MRTAFLRRALALVLVTLASGCALPPQTPLSEVRFAPVALPRGVATLSDGELGTPQLEPHPSWMVRIERQWTKRYGS